MNERQLQSFIQVADCKSFSKAARNCFISTPALIQQIDLLEQSLGFALFIRTNHGVKLTEAGQYFYKKSIEILRIYNDAVHYGLAITSSIIRIAISNDSYPDFLLDCCNRFMKENPKTQVQFISCPYNQQINYIRDCMADLAIIAKPKDELLQDIHYLPLVEDHYGFAMNCNHHLAKKDLIHLNDLKGETILCGHYPYLELSFEKGLAESQAHLISKEEENDLNTRNQSLITDSIIVFHSQWSNAYHNSLQVVLSDIPAGSIGILYKSTNHESAKLINEIASFFTE